ncbi:hypothetical protein [Metabacillus sp. 84]|uniref:hypothetical protein n=1 Tax=Metabacillus sp. 84 TaxID=3404705 RepID=UPI003CF9E74D
MNMANEYAVYKGDQFVCLGTVRECAAYMGVTEKTVRFWSLPVYRRRMEQSAGDNYIISFRIKEDEEEFG